MQKYRALLFFEKSTIGLQLVSDTWVNQTFKILLILAFRNLRAFESDLYGADCVGLSPSDVN